MERKKTTMMVYVDVLDRLKKLGIAGETPNDVLTRLVEQEEKRKV